MLRRKKHNVKRSLSRRIINGFIFFFIGIFFISILLFGFSQTSTFRNYLRNQILTITNDAITGEFNLGEINGTILTTLNLKDISLINNADTLFTAKQIDISINPFPLLIKKLYVEKIKLSDVNVFVLEREDGSWSVDNIFKEDSTSSDDKADSIKTEIETKGKFPFIVFINELNLSDLNFVVRNFKNRNSINYNKFIDFNDLLITDLNLNAQIEADVNNNDFQLKINHFTFSPNLSRFRLIDLAGNFHVTENYAEVEDLYIITDSSAIQIDAKLDGINLFGRVDLEKFENYPLKFNFKADPFTFSDLSTFIDAVDFIRGPIFMTFSGEGKFGDFKHNAYLQMNHSTFALNGRLRNLHTPDKLYIDASFTNSNVDYIEVEELLYGLELPHYPDLVVENININYSGEPTKFNGNGNAKMEDGSFTFKSFMDLQKEQIEYDYQFTTTDIDLFDLIGYKTKINSNGSFKGTGFDPAYSNSILNFNANNLDFEDYHLDTLAGDLITNSKVIDLSIHTKIDSAEANISGLLDLNEIDMPIYNLVGNFNKLDLAYILNDSSYSSSLNYSFSLDGHSLDLDKTEGSFKLNFHDSRVGENYFDKINFNIDLKKNDDYREIELQSDLLDFKIYGEFLLQNAFDLLSYQVNKSSYVLANKIDEINPFTQNSIVSDTVYNIENNEAITNQNFFLEYDFSFKDFKLIAALIGRDEVSISGTGEGYVENDSSDFSLSTDIDINYLFLIKEDNVFYASDLNTAIDFSMDNQSFSFDNLFGSFSIAARKIASDISLNNMNADIIFNEEKTYFNLAADLSDYLKTRVEGNIIVEGEKETLNLKQLDIDYREILWSNKEAIEIINTPDLFEINNFALYNNGAKFAIDGSINNKLEQDLTVELTNGSGNILGKYLLGINEDELAANLNIKSEISGTSINPVITISSQIKDITIENQNVGSLFTDLKYEMNNLSIETFFTNKAYNKETPLLKLDGNIPIYLGTDPEKYALDSTKSIDLKLVSTDFNLRTLGNLLPGISSLNGSFYSNLEMRGSLNELEYYGTMSLKNTSFKSNLSNLIYGLETELIFNDQTISVKKLQITNSGNSKFNGVMNVTGNLLLSGYSLQNIDLMLNGNLALLNPFSKETSPNLYGDLFVSTDDAWHYTYENGYSNFEGTIILNDVNLNVTPFKSAYTVGDSEFKYIFLVDSSTVDKQQLKYEKLLTTLRLKNRKKSDLPENFDIKVKVKINNLAKVSVVLSKPLNQKLIADMTGEIQIETVRGELRTQGEFNILPSSMFTFYKTFQTEGNIKFESDLTDPRLDLVATYTADYINPNVSDSEPEKTAVKIKINDSASSLTESIASKNSNVKLEVYMGKNIELNIPSTQYTRMDAVVFILFGVFEKDLQSADLASNAGFSVLGSTLTSVLNQKFGDAINNVNINKAGNQTRFNISGRVQQVRYTVGGTEETFTNLNQANVKVEYLFNPKLIMRLERRDPVISSSAGETEKVNEFGLMYKFTF